MNVDDDAAGADFRASLRSWLATNLPADRPAARAGALEDDDDWFAFMQSWARVLAEGGYAGVSWPKEFGGRGATAREQMIFSEELARADAPFHIDIIGIGMAGPTLITHGSREQQARYLPTILDGSEIWCQLWSEPNAGSDLAAVETRAEWGEGRWVVSGQKVWTTIAQRARWGLLLARTDPTLPKHKGLTYFIVDMRSAGVQVRPLRAMDGSVEFNEVFLDEVAIPDSERIGPVNDGWKVMTTSLMNERFAVGGGSMDYTENFNDVIAAVRATGRESDLLIRQQIGDLYVDTMALRLLRIRLITLLDSGGEPGPEGSILKLKAAEYNVKLHEFGMRVLGTEALRSDSDIARRYLRSRGSTIEGGTSEIQRNILAERVLGMPRELRPHPDPPAGGTGA